MENNKRKWNDEKIDVFYLECRPYDPLGNDPEEKHDTYQLTFRVRTNKREFGLRKIYGVNHLESIFDRIFDDSKKMLEEEIFKMRS